MSFGIFVKASNDVPLSLLEDYDIPTEPIIYRGIRFIDTCRFMASKLSTLAKNLLTPDFSKFRETGKHFATSDMDLVVTRKGVYPYEYTDEWSKLDENALPNKAEFYSILTESAIKDEEYEHAMKVWDHFECKTIGEYSDLYLKIDVLLLADIFENFRDVCMKTYNIDPAYYYTTPGFSFDAMLKYTAIKLELLSEYEMLLMFEDGIRGGLTQASMRYAKSNNEKTPDYNQANPKSWLVYQDCNNLYGWAMSQYMPYGDFKWVKPSLDGLNDLTEDSPIGRVYEVDIVYSKKIHDKHNDLPFLPQNSIPPGSKVRSVLTEKNETDKEVAARIQSGNKCLYGLIRILGSRSLSRDIKLQLYTTLLRPIITYGAETWTLRKTEENKLSILERKILRKIFGPVKDEETEGWRIRKNKELEELF
ncbi:hypothetical protein QTP88_009265 [Uroleucon formosanum]